jgi:hypothetical protein
MAMRARCGCSNNDSVEILGPPRRNRRGAFNTRRCGAHHSGVRAGSCHPCDSLTLRTRNERGCSRSRRERFLCEVRAARHSPKESDVASAHQRLRRVRARFIVWGPRTEDQSSKTGSRARGEGHAGKRNLGRRSHHILPSSPKRWGRRRKSRGTRACAAASAVVS